MTYFLIKYSSKSEIGFLISISYLRYILDVTVTSAILFSVAA